MALNEPTARQKLNIEYNYYIWWMNDDSTLAGAVPPHPLVIYLDTLFGDGGWVWIVPKHNIK